MKDNKLIAEFMGLQLVPCNIGTENGTVTEGYQHPKVDVPCTADGLQYKYSWDWLMPVVEKIESDERYDVDILQYGTRIREGQKEIVNNIADISFDKKIEHTYDAVVEFINQLNNNNHES